MADPMTFFSALGQAMLVGALVAVSAGFLAVNGAIATALAGRIYGALSH